MRSGLRDLRELIGFVLVLIGRGLALWFLIPLTVVVWGVLRPIHWIRHKGDRPTLRQYLAWVDSTFVALLEHGPLRPVSPDRPAFPAWPRNRGEVPYRISPSDLV